MNNQYTSFAGVILDGPNGPPIGLSFPIDVGYKPITGPETWKIYLKDIDTLFAEWTTFRAERDLLASHIRGEVDYDKIRHLVEAKELPEPECNCFLPEQSCSICQKTGEEIPF